MDIEKFFFDFYFKEICERMKIPLDFFNPKGSSKNPLENFAVPKTINNQFISIISKSSLFVSDLEQFLKKGFNSEYEATINFKLGFLIKRWSEELSQSKNIAQTLQ